MLRHSPRNSTHTRNRPDADKRDGYTAHLPGVGVAGGFMSGLFGVGAGIVAALLLVRGFGLRQAVAQGMGLAMVLPGSVLTLATFAQAQQVDWRTGCRRKSCVDCLR